MSWQDIKTCGSLPHEKVDLWIVPAKNKWGERVKPFRAANAYRSGNGKHWLSSEGGYLEGRTFLDEDFDECFDIDDRGPDATRVTHWQPLPAPPKETE